MRIFALALLFLSACGLKDESDLIGNYEDNKEGIDKLIERYKELTPQNYLVRLRFSSSNTVDMVVYEPTSDSTKRELLFRQWDVDLDDYVPEPRTEYNKKYHGRTNSLEEVKDVLSWNRRTFQEIYDLLNNVNCMGISNRNPIELEYDYRLMGVFSYYIFDSNLNSQEQAKYSDNCSTQFYKDNIVLAYGSGATGSECWPAFENKADNNR